MTVGRSEDEYLDEEYRNKIESFVAAHPDEQLSVEDVQRQFDEECAFFEDFFRDGAPLPVIRRAAFQKVTRKLE